MKLKNKTALITGASGGIGKAMALLFAQEGANIAIHCLNHGKEEDDLMKVIRSKYKRKVECFEADISKLTDIKEMVSKVHKTFGRIDILINNAGIFIENSFFETTEETWEKALNTNLKGAYFCAQYVAKIMLKQKSGNILNISSVAGIYPRKDTFEYDISKAGLIHFSKSLALILAPHIRVNSLAPSYTLTGLLSFMKDPKAVKEKIKLVPLGRLNEPEDIAKAALFLVSEDSRNITGQVLIVDGGRGAAI